MVVGERVKAIVAMPGIPAGARGRVAEIGRLFVVVEFEDGRISYYRRSQLELVGKGLGVVVGGEFTPLLLGSAKHAVRPGSHLCLLPSTPEAQMETVSSYLLAGLAAGETCVCIAPGEMVDTLARSVEKMAEGMGAPPEVSRISFECTGDVYQTGSDFTAEKQLQTLAGLAEGLAGPSRAPARLFGYCGYVPSCVDAQEWWQYERKATGVLEQHRVTALCGYESDGWQTEVWQRAYSVHPYVVCGGKLTTGGAWTC